MTRKVLVAEPDLISQSFYREAFQKWGFEVLIADSASQAWEKFSQEQPEFIVIDLQLPGPDNLALCRRMRESMGKGYSFIVVTAEKSAKEALFEALEAGADDSLVKPVDMAELRAKIRAGQRILDLEQQLQNRIQKLEESNQLIAKVNNQMKRDLYAVAKIQASLLPASLPTIPGLEVAWVYKPRDELAGDCLNVLRLDEKHTAFYVLDVSGSGTGAALLSVSLSREISPFPSQSTLLKQLLPSPPGYKIIPPAEVLAALNRSFPLDEVYQQYFTIFYGILDVESGELIYSMAGHPRPLLMRADQIEMIPGGGHPIGFVDEASFEENSVCLNAGDRLFVYSDGISEAMNAARQFFGKQTLSEKIDQTRAVPLKESLAVLLSEGEKWCGGKGLADDVSILAFEFKGKGR